MKTVQGWRDFVRTYMDVEAEDVPDLLIDGWLIDAVQIIRQREVGWPCYQANGSFTTVADTQAYAIPLTSVGATWRDITMIIGPWEPLQRMSHRAAEDVYFVPTGVTAFSGYPEAFSIWNDQIYIWPAPNDAYTMTVRGYRNLKNWYVGGDSVPDVPDQFEPALRDWMLSEAMLHSQDAELAANFKSKFDEKLGVLLEDQLRPSRFSPYVKGGRGRGRIVPQHPRFPHWSGI